MLPPFETQLFIIIACVTVVITTITIYRIFLKILSRRDTTVSYDELKKEAERGKTKVSVKKFSTDKQASEHKAGPKPVNKEAEKKVRTFNTRTADAPPEIKRPVQRMNTEQTRVSAEPTVVTYQSYKDGSKTAEAPAAADTTKGRDGYPAKRTFNTRTPDSPARKD
ncbi:MAG: hypothetical protein IKJ69_04125 [Clostridia bacterium]|nr:hypothetical protein [Clostridia bacterium]